MNANQPEIKTRSALDKAVDWGFLIAAGLSAFNLPADIINYHAGKAGLLPIIGNSGMVIAYGLNKWAELSAKPETIIAARADVSAAKSVREDEVEELESRLGRRPDNRNFPKP